MSKYRYDPLNTAPNAGALPYQNTQVASIGAKAIGDAAQQGAATAQRHVADEITAKKTALYHSMGAELTTALNELESRIPQMKYGTRKDVYQKEAQAIANSVFSKFGDAEVKNALNADYLKMRSRGEITASSTDYKDSVNQALAGYNAKQNDYFNNLDKYTPDEQQMQIGLFEEQINDFVSKGFITAVDGEKNKQGLKEGSDKANLNIMIRDNPEQAYASLQDTNNWRHVSADVRSAFEEKARTESARNEVKQFNAIMRQDPYAAKKYLAGAQFIDPVQSSDLEARADNKIESLEIKYQRSVANQVADQKALAITTGNYDKAFVADLKTGTASEQEYAAEIEIVSKIAPAVNAFKAGNMDEYQRISNELVINPNSVLNAAEKLQAQEAIQREVSAYNAAYLKDPIAVGAAGNGMINENGSIDVDDNLWLLRDQIKRGVPDADVKWMSDATAKSFAAKLKELQPFEQSATIKAYIDDLPKEAQGYAWRQLNDEKAINPTITASLQFGTSQYVAEAIMNGGAVEDINEVEKQYKAVNGTEAVDELRGKVSEEFADVRASIFSTNNGQPAPIAETGAATQSLLDAEEAIYKGALVIANTQGTEAARAFVERAVSEKWTMYENARIPNPTTSKGGYNVSNVMLGMDRIIAEQVDTLDFGDDIAGVVGAEDAKQLERQTKDYRNQIKYAKNFMTDSKETGVYLLDNKGNMVQVRQPDGKFGAAFFTWEQLNKYGTGYFPQGETVYGLSGEIIMP